VQQASPGISTFTYTVVGFVVLMIFVKLMSAMRDEQKEGTRFRNRFIKPDAKREVDHDDESPPNNNAQ
jgi:hypothetical protein